MSVADIITQLLGLLAGIGVFLLSIKIISQNLEAVGGNKLKLLFSKTSNNNVLGVGIGTAATALIQSSGATSVMAIGFVSAGVMSLTQGCAIVLGSNIGTTITGQIVALGFIGKSTSLSASAILASLAGIGAFMMYFGKKDTIKKIGYLLCGFGLLFVGLSLMSSSMKTFADVESVKQGIASINFPGYSIVLVLIGIVLTAIIQSSSVTSSIGITMLVSGLISLDQGIFLILGSNIGACVVSLLACIGAPINAKRLGIFHLIETIVRVFIYLIIVEIITASTNGVATSGALFELMFPDALPFQLAMFHTIFNVVTVIIFMPFMPFFIKICEKMLPEKSGYQKEETEKQSILRTFYIDQHLIKTPPIAVQAAKNEIINMAEIAMRNFELSYDIICKMDFTNIEQFRENENLLNFLNKELTKFIIPLSKKNIVEKDHLYLSTAYHTISDLERIGDYAENIVEYALTLKEADECFSEDAVSEIRALQKMIEDLFQKVMKAYVSVDLTALKDANEIEDQIDNVTKEMETNHIQRLDQGVCKPDIGAQYLSLTSNSERVADHLINVSKSILTLCK